MKSRKKSKKNLTNLMMSPANKTKPKEKLMQVQVKNRFFSLIKNFKTKMQRTKTKEI